MSPWISSTAEWTSLLQSGALIAIVNIVISLIGITWAHVTDSIGKLAKISFPMLGLTKRMGLDYAEQYGISILRGLIPAAASGILSAKNAVEYVTGKCRDSSNIPELKLFSPYRSEKPVLYVDELPGDILSHPVTRSPVIIIAIS